MLAGFRIAVDDSGGVQGADRGEDRQDELQGGRQRQHPLAVDPLGETLPLDELHDQEGHALVDPEVEDVDDMGMAHLSRGATFAQEASFRDRGPRLLRRTRMQDLDRDALPERLVMGLVDDPHPTASDDPNEFVIAQPGA